MAGIGFVLRKLMREKNLSSLLAAYFHSTMAAAGPWILTILALGSFYLLSQSIAGAQSYIAFRLIIMFNFSVSLVIAAPITNCSTRYLADLIYEKVLTRGAGLMMGMILILFSIAIPVSWIYYGLFTKMSFEEKFFAVINFMLVASIWHAAIFISALKYYKVVSVSFALGMILSVLGAIFFSRDSSMLSLLHGFNIGLGFIVASLLALVFREYPPVLEDIFKVATYFKKYWEVAFGFFIYSLGLWIDKWMMWFAPESVQLPNLMRMYPDYDSAMFISYLSVIPAMAFFLLSQETAFYEKYFIYYQGIQNHDNYEKIKFNQKELVSTTWTMGRNLLVLQTFICITAILLAPYIFNFLGLNLIEISMFRIGALGASLQILSLFTMIILSYFDDRRDLLKIQTFFFLSNLIFTAITMYLGLPFYGYGFFLSSLFTFLIGVFYLDKYTRLLPYHTFVTQNIRRPLTPQLVSIHEGADSRQL